MRAGIFALALAGLAASATAASATDIAVLTAFQSSVTTNQMINVFEAKAKEAGWNTTVVDTRGDMGQLASRIEDVVAAKTGAIVLVSVDPKLIQDQVNAAAAAGIPVIAIDGATAPGVVLNVTSDNFELGTKLSDFLFEKLGHKGNIVKYYYSAHPGVHQRELALDEALKKNPDIKVIADHYMVVPGPIDDARKTTEDLLKSKGDEIDAIWAAWDEPAIGAQLAIEADKPDSKIIIAGIDGNPQAIELIKACSHIKGTVSQDFDAMAGLAADGLTKILAGTKPEKPELYAPAKLITPESLGVTCP
ncbi:sugar ABC transporter substrate-binding protein [Kaistia dalseonensis]|uniref:Ribose transport system substrate-binding protein n=1 Tax=Kaistia dalseonensis TaxID=410840 RepID=A0ABU0H5Q4_9HYPH|nr:sugar ABC transporter substrate-binding protein [Kaistia dalseonensis]MCX5495064.1 sugar ABC transporter substrate-binding protein [Kaistia dalseonensis]MDQ0437646.1 ribose transport system substrate-binding protein [Kaistia dalseonensis]